MASSNAKPLILVSAFERFGEDSINSSEVILNCLQFRNEDLQTIILPVSFRQCWKLLKNEIDKVSPALVLMLGQAKGREKINLEKIALNYMDCEIPDVDGWQPRDQVIDLQNDLALHNPLRLEDFIYPDIKKSLSAGAYVCNFLYYQALKWSKVSHIPVLFVHLPALPDQVEGTLTPSMDMFRQTEGVEKIIRKLSGDYED